MLSSLNYDFNILFVSKEGVNLGNHSDKILTITLNILQAINNCLNIYTINNN